MCNEIKKDENIIDTKYSKLSSYISKDNTLAKEDIKINVNDDGLIVFRTIHFDSDMIIFENSKIYISIENNNSIEININISELRFIDCKFSANTFFKNSLDSLEIHRCIFEERCYINNQYEDNNNEIEIKNLKIKEAIFKNNFKLHNVLLDKFEIRDTDFIKNADFFKTIFKSGAYKNIISFHAINFNELALFGDTKFHEFLQFKYVTFKGYSHFRSAYFHQGFDLEYANIEKEMNFFNVQGLDTEESKMYTSQETYRIIKYQLQKVGNMIDSNKYHSLELSKNRESIWAHEDVSFILLQRGIVSFFHWLTSAHSNSWMIALFWILVVGFMTREGLSDIAPQCCSDSFRDIFKYVSIVNFDDCIKKDPVIFVLNKALLGYLYYQFLTAVRKDTRK